MRNTHLFFLATLLAAAIYSCSQAPQLPRDNWNDSVYAALDELIRSEGISSPDYDPQCRPYAVFDYDNTTIINDISLTLMIYQIENLNYAFSPDEAFGRFTANIPDLDCELKGILPENWAPDGPKLKADREDGKGWTARELAQGLSDDFAVLMSMKADGMALDEIRSSNCYLDFRARLLVLNEGVEHSFDYGIWCLWQPSLFFGMSWEELQSFTRESVDHWLSFGPIRSEIWDSPDGSLSVEVRKGMALPQENIHLYKCLQDNGFDVYICSASLEKIVEAMACDPKYGLNIPPENVFGIRLADEQICYGELAPDYDQTYQSGKTACIRKLIAPSHCGRQPSLIAGDSNGDYPMLSDFDSLRLGLIIDCKRSGPIARLAAEARAAAPAGDSPATDSGASAGVSSATDSGTPAGVSGASAVRYVVQDRDLSIPGFVRSASVD